MQQIDNLLLRYKTTKAEDLAQAPPRFYDKWREQSATLTHRVAIACQKNRKWQSGRAEKPFGTHFVLLLV